ncbi:hypothetical protein C8F04DRAFT_1188290 [Mycena alexandri]|uniref:Uncharacterized protein n=1 Tax=Mycena alexandri TaxID=1745969 RepID=A0AAD6SJV0_9AGAR|nr:hypothetical protein C8F04DRAFT_1188290 [Mycena alexandri]
MIYIDRPEEKNIPPKIAGQPGWNKRTSLRSADRSFDYLGKDAGDRSRLVRQGVRQQEGEALPWKQTNTRLWMSYIGLSTLAAMPNPSNPRIAYFLVGGFLQGWFSPKTGLERAYGGKKWFEFELGAKGAGNRQKESGIG